MEPMTAPLISDMAKKTKMLMVYQDAHVEIVGTAKGWKKNKARKRYQSSLVDLTSFKAATGSHATLMTKTEVCRWMIRPSRSRFFGKKKILSQLGKRYPCLMLNLGVCGHSGTVFS